jgi:hypothetical protein
MSLAVGIDIGTVSVKGAIVGDPDDRPLFQRLVEAGGFSFQPASLPLLLSLYRRTLGIPCNGDPYRHGAPPDLQ